MQYFSSKNQYTCTLDGILESLDCLLKNVGSIQRLRIIGGEPLMFKDLPQLVAELEQRKKVRSFDILTNVAIDFKEDLLQAIKKAKKFRKVSIFDYSASFLTGGIWYKVEKVYKRNRTKEEIVANFHACGMSCVSLMSGDTRENVRTNESKASAGRRAIFVCPVASSLSKLKGIDEFSGDYIALENGNLRDRILAFYAQDFFKACDYCQD